MKNLLIRKTYFASVLCLGWSLMGLGGCSDSSDLTSADDEEILEDLAAMIVGDIEPTAPASSLPESPASKGLSKKGLSKPADVQTLEWTDLMPKEDLDALASPPEFVDNVQEGSVNDTINGQLRNTVSQGKLSPEEERYQQALTSTKVVPEMAGKMIRIPGFVVPLTFDDQEQITEFFLVPFFGACIHMPAPPPNQIIFVQTSKGFRVEHLFDPIWVIGKLAITLTENELASAAYSLTMDHFEEYPFRG